MLSRLSTWLHVTAGPIRFKLTLAEAMRSRVRLFTVTLALSTGVGACAAIWGFQDAIDRPGTDDGGIDADATVNAGDSRLETGTTLDHGAPDATAITQSEGAMPTDTVDAESGEGAADATSGIDATDAPSGIGATDSPSGIDVVFQCDAACVPTPPIGWEGPFEISEGDGGPLPGCNALSWVNKYLLGASPNGAPAACSCSCGQPSNVTCSAPVVTYFARLSDCPQLGGCATLTLDYCAATSSVAPCGRIPRGFQVGSSNAAGGSCNPGGSTILPPIGWGANVRLCAPAAESTNGCAPASLCLPTPDPQFQNAFCIVARTDAGACPTAYPIAHPRSESGGAFYFADAGDKRSCSPCTCGPPGGVTCANPSILAYNNSDTCMPRTDGIPLPDPTGCNSTTGILGMQFAGAIPSGGKCAPDGGQPQGAIVPTAPYTICCTQ
ncbi:MAG TPA: hypothetical protein VGY54_10290 [Polyangiaceae bacterium]|jgi:hypothetical protein|nr:hypothetical protein [Polyangiaceae bacterium]